MQDITPRGYPKVIQTDGYKCFEGFSIQVTLPSGKFVYTGIKSDFEGLARKIGLECKTVHFFGCCISSGINDRAHDNFPIQIDGVDVKDFLDQIATMEEYRSFEAEFSRKG